MNRTAPLATALLTTLALGASPAHAFGGFSVQTFTFDTTLATFDTELVCDDGVDNDGDGLVDYADSDCDDRQGVPTIDVAGSAGPGGDDIHPIPDFFLAWSDDGSDLGLFAQVDATTDRDGNVTYTYEVVVSGLANFEASGLLKNMSVAIGETDGDGYADVVMAMPEWGTGLVMAYTDVYAGEQSFYDYSGFVYTSYSSYMCSTSTGTYTHATSSASACTTNLADNLLVDDATGAVLFDLGYADYYGSGVGFRWALDATPLESGAAEDGGLVFIDAESGRTYYY